MKNYKGGTMGTLNGSSLFTGIYSGLTNTYSLISNQYSNNVTLENISAARTNTSLSATLNQSFASYIQTNFNSLDADKDGVISAVEMNNLTNQISTQGMTKTQLAQLGTASGLSSETLSDVLEHFNDIDANKDGKITTAEISAFKINSAAEKKKTEFANRAATNMSVFYGDENASSAADSSSLLSYKYLSDKT